MSATVTLTFSTPQEMLEFFKGIGQIQAIAPARPAAGAAAPVKPVAAPAPVAVAPAKAAAPAPAPAPAAPIEAAVVNGVRYTDLQQAVQKLATQQRAAAVALLAQFGVPHFKELSPEKWADALAACNAKLAELTPKEATT